MRPLLSNPDLTISVFVAVAIVSLFAFVLGASLEVVANMLVIGIATAIVECVVRARQPSRGADLGTKASRKRGQGHSR